MALKEINFLANVESPYIVKFYRNMFIKEENRFYLLMELGENSLTDTIENLLPEKAEKYFKEICLGLQKIHHKHDAHRDLKPDNILICKDVAKLCDFGITKKVEGTLTVTSLVGTVSYMAPEILKNEKFNIKCDIWALGLIYLQMITKNKKCLFHGKKKDETIKNILEQKVMLPENLTPKQNQIIQGCLERNIDKRKTVDWILDLLEKKCEEEFSEEAKNKAKSIQEILLLSEKQMKKFLKYFQENPKVSLIEAINGYYF